MPGFFQILFKRLDFNVAGIYFSPSYLQAGGMIVLLFLLIVMIAQFRRHYLDWSFKGALFGFFWGFIMALALEGFLFVSGKNLLINTLGWKTAPKPIVNVLDLGRNALTKVLGTHN
jgi:hypothetical protein